MNKFTVFFVAFVLASPLFAENSQPSAEGLVMWFKAEEGVQCAPDGSVASWANSATGPDREEGDLTTVGSQDATKPFVEYINGLPAVHLSGEGAALSLKLTKPIPQPLTMLMVLQWKGKQEAGYVYIFGSGGSEQEGQPDQLGLACGKFPDVVTTDGFFLRAGKAEFPRLDLTPFTEKASLLGLIADGPSSQFFGLDTEYAKGDPGPDGLLQTFVIGSFHNLLWGGNFLVAEILVYNHSMDYAEREKSVLYLKKKYALTP